MNRIAGCYCFDGSPADLNTLERMAGSMKLRGEDRHAAWVEGSAGLGCTRIGRTDEASHDPSPHRHPNGKWVIVFDGRIDNRQELSEALKYLPVSKGCPVSDERLVLAAYEKWGEDFACHLAGDFALAIWDRQAQTLICVRDQFGVKPLYYASARGAFVFASTPRAVLASGMVQPEVNEGRIADFLVNPLEGVDKTSTFYTEVFRLEPAHLLIVRADGLKKQQYWRLALAPPEALAVEDETIESFRELFARAVRGRLRGTAVPASMLSGGLDSSTIACMGARILREDGRGPLHVFSAVSETPEINRETAHIQAILGQGSFQAHLVSETWLRQHMDVLTAEIEAESEPFDCLMNLNRAVDLHAMELGITALLDGIDGDVLLASPGLLPQLWRQGAFRTIHRETIKAGGLTAEYETGRRLFFRSLVSAITPPAPEWLRRIRRPIRSRKTIASAVRETIINLDFAIRVRLGERFSRLHDHSPRPATGTLMEYHRISLEHPFLTVGLERYERVNSCFGIEVRHPFTDIRLAEFCVGLPWQLKSRDGWTKYILRKALEPSLPSTVIWRTDKDNLMWEFNRVILKEKAEYFHQLTMDEGNSLKPYVDMNKLTGYWQEYLRGGDETQTALIWSGIALAMWLRWERRRRAGDGEDRYER